MVCYVYDYRGGPNENVLYKRQRSQHNLKVDVVYC